MMHCIIRKEIKAMSFFVSMRKLVAPAYLLYYYASVAILPPTATMVVDAFVVTSSSGSSSLSSYFSAPKTLPSSESVVPWTTKIKLSTTSSFSSTRTGTRTTTTELSMVFDFFKERSSEGLDQLTKLTEAASKGNIRQGLAEAATYTQVTNEAFAEGLAKSRNRFLNNLDSLFSGGTFSSNAETVEELLEELQDVLLQADLGVATSEDIVNEVRSLSLDKQKEGKEAEGSSSSSKVELLSREDLMSIMRGVLIETLDFDKKKEMHDDVSDSDDNDNAEKSTTVGVGASAIRFASKEDKIPTVLFVMGANGMGKTTTIGKLANRLRIEGDQKVLMAACDTFRAGAVEQLQMWADRAEVDMIGPSASSGSTPTSIIGDALDKAMAEGYDTVLVDTAGRLSNNWELNEELVKMKTIIQTKLSSTTTDTTGNNNDVPHEVLLVLDAAQGRMALDSARIWNKEIGLTGLILTKLDGSARGGSVVAISRDLNLPVKLIGVGEGINDLRDFEGEKFVDGLLGIGSAGGNSDKEGEALASRLQTLRREREKRVPEIVTLNKRTLVTASADNKSNGSFNHVSPQGATPPARNVGSKKRNRRKKGKRGKR